MESFRKTWLRTTFRATSNTGLAADDVFYFGNMHRGFQDRESRIAGNGTDQRNRYRECSPEPIALHYVCARDQSIRRQQGWKGERDGHGSRAAEVSKPA